MERVMIIMKLIKIDFSLLIVLLLSLFTGYFKEILCIYLIILLHEIGHILWIIIFKGSVSKIRISFFGSYITSSNLSKLNIIKKTIINIGRHYYKYNYNTYFSFV